jgi:hypothetical protein
VVPGARAPCATAASRSWGGWRGAAGRAIARTRRWRRRKGR